jgi:rhodanese-related sulfurtransferase
MCALAHFTAMIHQMTVTELQQRLQEPARNFVIIDVREPWEAEVCSLPDAIMIPMGQVPGRIDEIDRDQDVIVICHHGIRSQQIAYYLQNAGFENLFNLRGGIDAWAREIDPDMATY